MKIIHSIGHSNLEAQKFVDLLNQYNITCVVDIRSVPYSRFCPQFNKAKLENKLQENNIKYQYEGLNLGGRITDPECYLNKQLPERKVNIAETINYNVLRSRPWFNAGIQSLVLLSENYNVAIMCSEEDPDRCHRKLLVGKRLEEEGFRIIHIRSKLEKNCIKSPELFE